MNQDLLRIKILRALPGDEKQISKKTGEPVKEVRKVLDSGDERWYKDGETSWVRSVRGDDFLKVNELELIDDVMKTKKKVVEKRKESSMVLNDNTLYEQIWDVDEGSRFIYLNGTGTAKYKNKVGDIYPIESKALEEGAVLLPDGIEDYVSIEKLVQTIKSHIHKYLDVSDEYETFASYYVLLSWVYDKTNTVAYLRALGDFGTGKSRFLNVIGRLLYKPCIIAGSVTPAPIYRLLGKWKGSLIVDEADFGDTSERSEIVTILNAGIEKGRPVIRCDKETLDLDFFDCFGPKIIASRRTYRDSAFESRCLRHIMKETHRKDLPIDLTKIFFREEAKLRNQLLKFRLDFYDKIGDDEIEFDFGDIEPRLKQISKCFVPVLKQIGGMEDDFREFIGGYSKKLVIERAESYDGIIFNTLVDMMVDDEPNLYITPKDIADIINKSIPDGKRKISPITVGKHLRQMGFEFRPKKIDNKTMRVFTYKKQNMLTIIERYVPADSDSYPKIKKMVTEVTGVTDDDEVTGVTAVTEDTGSVELQSKLSDVGLGFPVMTSNSITTYSSNIRDGEVTDGGTLSHSSVTSVTTVTDWEKIILKILSSREPLDSEKLAELFQKSLSDDSEFMQNPQRFWDIVDKLNEQGLIFQPNPGRWQKV